MAAFKLTQLRHFIAVAERRNIGMTASELHISQPALTRSIQRLEQEADGALFERGPRGVELTARGAALLPYVKAMVAEADRATEHLKTVRVERHARIKLGVSPNFNRHICPDIIVDFVEQFPNSNITTIAGTGEELLSLITAADIDLAIALAWGTTMDMAIAKNSELACERLTELSTGVFAPATHPLAAHTEVALEDLVEARWAIPHGLSISYVFRDIFLKAELPPPAQIINSRSIDHMLALSQRLDLLLVIPRHVAADAVRSGRLLPVRCAPLEIKYHVEMITRRRGTEAQGLTGFRRLVREHFARADLL